MPPTATVSRRVAWRAFFFLLLLLGIGGGGLTNRAHSQPPIPTFVVHARRFAFAPGAITLKKGQTVKLVLISDDVLHGLAVNGLRIRAEIAPGQPTEVLVTPTQVGDFPGICSVYCGGGHREMSFVVHVIE